MPESLTKRDDISIYRFEQSGLSNNRNNALEHCDADIILISDDDVTYTEDSLHEIINTFCQNPDVDIATFRSNNHPPHIYPATSIQLQHKLPKHYFVCSIEIALRRATAGHLRFCPELGLNSPKLHGGEDEIFVMSAIHRGLKCQFFPITICNHPHASTGTKSHITPAELRASGCVIAIMHPWTTLLRLPLKAIRISRAKQKSFVQTLYHLFSGALMAPGVRHRNRNYLW